MRRMERKDEDGEKEGMRRTRRERRDEKENCFMEKEGLRGMFRSKKTKKKGVEENREEKQS